MHGYVDSRARDCKVCKHTCSIHTCERNHRHKLESCTRAFAQQDALGMPPSAQLQEASSERSSRHAPPSPKPTRNLRASAPGWAPGPSDTGPPAAAAASAGPTEGHLLQMAADALAARTEAALRASEGPRPVGGPLSPHRPVLPSGHLLRNGSSAGMSLSGTPPSPSVGGVHLDVGLHRLSVGSHAHSPLPSPSPAQRTEVRAWVCEEFMHACVHVGGGEGGVHVSSERHRWHDCGLCWARCRQGWACLVCTRASVCVCAGLTGHVAWLYFRRAEGMSRHHRCMCEHACACTCTHTHTHTHTHAHTRTHTHTCMRIFTTPIRTHLPTFTHTHTHTHARVRACRSWLPAVAACRHLGWGA